MINDNFTNCSKWRLKIFNFHLILNHYICIYNWSPVFLNSSSKHFESFFLCPLHYLVSGFYHLLFRLSHMHLKFLSFLSTSNLLEVVHFQFILYNALNTWVPSLTKYIQNISFNITLLIVNLCSVPLNTIGSNLLYHTSLLGMLFPACTLVSLS